MAPLVSHKNSFPVGALGENAKTPSSGVLAFYLGLRVVDEIRTYYQSNPEYFFIPRLSADAALVS